MKRIKSIFSVLIAILLSLLQIPVFTITTNAENNSGFSNGDTFYLGQYPQEQVTDENILSSLNALSSNWISYNYYNSEGNISDYMKYKDVVFQGKRYRGVTFAEYRPNANQQNNNYYTDTIYWFTYQPLVWRVIDASNNLALCENVIDSQAYHHTSSTINGYYANNYEQSDIRRFLINQFFNTAFSATEKDAVCETTLDNSAVSPAYSSNSTNDKVFLLSKSEVDNIDSSIRKAFGTDYASCQGLAYLNNGNVQNQMTRTAANNSYAIYYTQNRSGNWVAYYNWYDDTIFVNSLGVRPAIRYYDDYVYDIEDPTINHQFNDHTYRFFDDGISWSDAKSACETMGGHLVTINSEAEQAYLVDLVRSSTKKNMWIGASPENGNFKWVTGEPFAYTNWASGEPNNVMQTQNAVMMYTQNAAYPAGTWNDENENGRDWFGYNLSDFGFICEWEILIPNDPTEFSVIDDGYPFDNFYESFDYTSSLNRIPYGTYKKVFKNYTRNLYVSSASIWGGNCFGMSVSAILFNEGKLKLSDYFKTGTSLNQCAESELVTNFGFGVEGFTHFYKYLPLESKIRELIECYQIWLNSKEFDKYREYCFAASDGGQSTIGSAIYLLNNFDNHLVNVSWMEGSNWKGHSMVIDTSRKPYPLDGSGWYRIYLYDPNYSFNSTMNKSNPKLKCLNRYLDVNINNNHWRVTANTNAGTNANLVGYNFDDQYIDNTIIQIISFDTLQSLPTIFDGTATLIGKDTAKTTVALNSKNIRIKDNNNETVFLVENSKITYIADRIRIINTMSGEKQSDSFRIELPLDVYSFEFGSAGSAQYLSGEYRFGINADENTSVNITNTGTVTVSGNGQSAVKVALERLKENDEYISVSANIENDGINNTSISLTEEGLNVDNNGEALDFIVESNEFEGQRVICGITDDLANCNNISQYAEENGETALINIQDCAVRGESVYQYSSQDIELQIELFDLDTLVYGTDYIFTGDYKASEIGTHYFQIQGMGKYTGSLDLSYEIIPALKFNGASLTLQNDLKINFTVKKELIDNNGYSEPFVVFSSNEKSNIVTEYTEKTSDGVEYYVFSFNNIAPDRMNDTITASLCATYNGDIYSGPEFEYSVATYCYSMLNTTTDAKLRTLLVDLLNYGTASQIYTGYNDNALVNALLTDEQKLWGTIDDPVMTTIKDSHYRIVNNPSVIWKGASLNLNDSITMQFIFSTDDINNITIKIEDKNEAVIEEIKTEDFMVSGNYYIVKFKGLTAGQMSDAVYITAYREDTAISNTVAYSIESYAYSKQNDNNAYLATLVKAMMKYGNAAYAYVHNGEM